jgi:hypothetical protein
MRPAGVLFLNQFRDGRANHGSWHHVDGRKHLLADVTLALNRPTLAHAVAPVADNWLEAVRFLQIGVSAERQESHARRGPTALNLHLKTTGSFCPLRRLLMNIEEEDLHQAYLTRLIHDHQDVRQSLVQVEKLWIRCRGSTSSKASLEELIRSLTNLRVELAQHFAEEEAGGCVEEAVSHAPWLGREASDLEREDPELLGLLDGLIAAVKRRPKSIKEVDKDFRQFVDRLRHHEAAESRIIAISFGMDAE